MTATEQPPIMDGRTKRALIIRYVLPESLKAKGAWRREMHLANGLVEQYPDVRFWLNELTLGIWLRSLAGLKTAKGREDLERQWRHYQAERSREAQVNAEQSPLDIGPNPDTVEEVKPRRRQNAIEWADSNEPPL